MFLRQNFVYKVYKDILIFKYIYIYVYLKYMNTSSLTHTLPNCEANHSLKASELVAACLACTERWELSRILRASWAVFQVEIANGFCGSDCFYQQT